MGLTLVRICPILFPGRHLGFFIEDRQIEGYGLHRQFLVHPDQAAGDRDLEVAIPLREFEHRVYRFLALVGAERNLPGEVGLLRIQPIQRRQAVHVAMDAHLAQPRQIAQEQRGIIALGVEVGLGLEDDLIGDRLDGQLVARFEIVEGEGNRLEAFLVDDGSNGGSGGRDRLRRRLGSGLRQFAIGERFELLDELTAAPPVDAAAVAGGIGQIGEHIRRPQHDFQNVLSGFQPVGSNAVERRFEYMREGDEIVEPESAGATLDGMDRTENGIHRFRVAIAVIEL